jgi:hypothetical protein
MSKFINDIDKARELQKILTLSKNEAKQAVEENKQEFANAYNNIKTVLKTQIKAGDATACFASFFDKVKIFCNSLTLSISFEIAKNSL